MPAGAILLHKLSVFGQRCHHGWWRARLQLPEFPVLLNACPAAHSVNLKARLAAEAGHLACLTELRDRFGADLSDNRLCEAAASGGHVECLAMLLAQRAPGAQPLDSIPCIDAARCGSLDCLRMAHEVGGCPIDADVIEVAAYNGHVDCLFYIHEAAGVPVTERLCCDMAASGHLAYLVHARERCGVDMSADICCAACFGGSLACLEYAHRHMVASGGTSAAGLTAVACADAAYGGNLDCLRYAHERGGAALDDVRICQCAADKGNYDCLVYAHERGAPLSAAVCTMAADRGCLRCLAYAHEHGAPLTADVCPAAFDSVECMAYAHERGAPVAGTAVVAAMYGRLRGLRYALEVAGEPLDPGVYEIAITIKQPSCLRYLALWHGIPASFAASIHAAPAGVDADAHDARLRLCMLPFRLRFALRMLVRRWRHRRSRKQLQMLAWTLARASTAMTPELVRVVQEHSGIAPPPPL